MLVLRETDSAEPIVSEPEEDFVTTPNASHVVLSWWSTIAGTIELIRIWVDGTPRVLETYNVVANAPTDVVIGYRVPRLRVRFVPAVPVTAPYDIEIELNSGGTSG